MGRSFLLDLEFWEKIYLLKYINKLQLVTKKETWMKHLSYLSSDLKMPPELFIMLFQKQWEPCDCWTDSHYTIVKLLAKMISKST